LAVVVVGNCIVQRLIVGQVRLAVSSHLNDVWR
jgi:hypothetical protein